MNNNFPSSAITTFEKIVIASVVSSYCLHLMRNIHGLFSITPIVFSLLGIFLLARVRPVFDRNGFFVLTGFVFIYCLSSFYSFFWYPYENYSLALARYFYMYPFLFFLLLLNFNFGKLIFALKVLSFFVLLGGGSIFYQVIFGPVSWFPDSSEREGLVRFSSLVGSLTSYGIVGGLTLPIILFVFKSQLLKSIFVFFITVAMLFTLQKAAVVNIILFFLYCIIFSKFRYKFLVCFCGVSLFCVLLYFSYVFNIGYAVATLDNFFRIRDGAGSSDVNFLQSVLDRLWSLPSVLYEFHGFFGMLFGVGLAGGSGALGMVDYPMAHNGFFDLLFIGGFLNLLSFLSVLFFCLYRLFFIRKVSDGDYEGLKFIDGLIFVYFLFIANMLFSGVIYFHPYSGVLFYSISVFVISSLPRLVSEVNESQRGRYV